ncbi:MAG: aromatic ring-hydroxylating oxygenase subunit alpha [Pigmentiphaga sp.]|uniref:aromatic ring-hydroxylating oxygenase subunit alpha n=1 Tax=Pigmentiphaga sp. TaxID=1977564 RepID=UPI003B56F038
MQYDDSPLQVRWPAQYNEIPKEVFHREDVYHRELERIFEGQDWHPVAHAAEVPMPGDYKTAQVGEARLLVVHGDDGRIRVFLNSCPHRGTQLKTDSRGNGTRIECPYHRWSFNNGGRLLGAPGSDQFPPAFSKADYGLREVRSDELHGLVFANFSTDGPPLDLFLGEAVDYLPKVLGGDGRLKLLGYQKVVYNANWKEYGDNEGYHAPLLHRAFRLLRWQGGKGMQLVTRYGHKVVEAELATPGGSFLNDASLVAARDPNSPPRSLVVSVFPMTTMVKHLDVINLRFAFPRSSDETEVHYAYFHHADDDADLIRHRLRQASNLLGPSGFISLEDGAVFNRLHQGSSTPGKVAFQKGYRGPMEAPCSAEQGDEASNLIRWERYREIMGFRRDD